MLAIEKMPEIFLPIFTQRLVVDVLDEKCFRIDEVIAKKMESIEEYRKLKQAFIAKAVT